MSEGRSAAVFIQNARKVYPAQIGGKAHTAVADVSIEVPYGSIHGLLGPNGAGKTTTLKMLLGLVRPTAGRFELLGTDARKRTSRARVGFLPEQPYYPGQLTARQLLKLFSRLAGVPREAMRSTHDELLQRVGLEGRGDTLLSHFSRGMLQRLGIAQALIGEPQLVILDEPASGLDPVGQMDVRNLMTELKAAGITVLLSSHQLSEVEAVCDRVSILSLGEVAVEGRIDDLLNSEGRTSVRVAGPAGGIPEKVRGLAQDVALEGDVSVFSVADENVRAVVDAVDDAGGRILSVVPKRESLEEYFARLIGGPDRAEGDR